jgi:hypothetical protein
MATNLTLKAAPMTSRVRAFGPIVVAEFPKVGTCRITVPPLRNGDPDVSAEIQQAWEEVKGGHARCSHRA